MGLKNGNVAHVRFRQIKKKILADNDTPSPSAAGMGDAGSPSKGPKDEAKSVHKRCASKDLAATPTKKKGSKSAGKVKEEPDIEDLFSRKSEDKEDFYYEEELVCTWPLTHATHSDGS